MVAMKVIFRLIVFVLVFAMFVTHQARGEGDCHKEKMIIMINCKVSIEYGDAFVNPSDKCRSLVTLYDIDCICRSFTLEDQALVDARNVIKLALICGKPKLEANAEVSN
ncbi:hypothetical protein HU200_027594 [Digitaria exilis]|uniref:Bifunctional inhibitor/plant lipid transfer protein/seed storage helical domain-containing protein n=1 Tax=Digitaria exilis TaxID=1010633 RepID=A0A835ER01_9POAL|nr:hypothetical protein HU200_027594 [Digitaria exilis]